jgi:hypothetical protein
MKLPKSLYSGYKLLKTSRLVKKKTADEEALRFFQSVLNEAQPTLDEEVQMYKFVKGMYNESKRKFLSFIKNTSMECMVLWTECSAIVSFLGLRNVAYVKWGRRDTLYEVTKFTNSHDLVTDRGAFEHPIVTKKRLMSYRQNSVADDVKSVKNDPEDSSDGEEEVVASGCIDFAFIPTTTAKWGDIMTANDP